MEKETTRISEEKYYGKVNLLYGYGCLDDIVIYKHLFTNQEINSSATATAKNNRKDSKQPCTTSSASTKNFRSSETSISATTTASREETDCLKVIPQILLFCQKEQGTKTGRKGLEPVFPFTDKTIIPRSFHRNRKSGLHSGLQIEIPFH